MAMEDDYNSPPRRRRGRGDDGLIVNRDKVVAFDPKGLAKRVLSEANAVSDTRAREALSMAVAASAKMVDSKLGSAVTKSPIRPVKIPANDNDIMKKLQLPVAPVSPLPDNVVPLFKDLAKERTLRSVNQHIQGTSIKMETLVKSINELKDTQQKVSHPLLSEQKKTRGIFSSMAGSIGSKVAEITSKNVPLFGKFFGKVEKQLSPMVKIGLKQLEVMKDFTKHMKKMLEAAFMDKLRGSVMDEAEPKRGFGQKMLDFFAPEESVIRNAIESTKATAKFYKTVGEHASKGLIGLLERIGVTGTGSGLTGTLGRGLLMIARSATLFGGLAALLTGSMILSLIKYPEQVGKYMEAFYTLWSENIAPTIKWLYENGIKPLGEMLWDWWNSTGESLFANIGYWINEGIIYVLGTALPATLTAIGKSFVASYEFISNQWENIKGMFGFGERGELGFFTNFFSIFTNFFSYMMTISDNLITAIARLFGVEDYYESFKTKVSDTISGIWNWFTGLIDKIFGFFGDALDLGKEIKEWLLSMLPDKVRSVLEMIIDGILEGIKNVFSPFDKIWNWVTSGQPEIRLLAKEPVQSTKGDKLEVKGVVERTYDDISNAIKENIEYGKKVAEEKVGPVYQNVMNQTTNAVNNTTNTVRGFISSRPDVSQTAWEAYSLGTGFMANVPLR